MDDLFFLRTGYEIDWYLEFIWIFFRFADVQVAPTSGLESIVKSKSKIGFNLIFEWLINLWFDKNEDSGLCWMKVPKKCRVFVRKFAWLS